MEKLERYLQFMREAEQLKNVLRSARTSTGRTESTAEHTWRLALLALVLTDIGMASLGSLLGALSQGQAARESLLSIVLFPLIIPILLAGIRVCAGGFSEALPEGVESWLGIAVAFDAVFLAAGLVLFPFVFSGDE